MSFKVGQKIDSKVILDTTGADSLLGKGDMLFTPPGSSALVRLHAPFITEEEIERVVEFLKLQREVVYDDSFLSEPNSDSSTVITDSPTINGDFDELFEEAKNVVLTDKKTSISYIQRKLQIGYNRSARIIEQLEMTGVLSAPNHKGHREILQG
jgi:S-DNA-T family DNA segregation ATPase FtsK/SpoIIIE